MSSIRDNLFGKGPRAGVGRPPAPSGYSQPPQQAPPRGYDEPPQQQGYGNSRPPPPPAKGAPPRASVGRAMPVAGMSRRLNLAPVEDKNLANQYIFGNM